MERLQCRNHRCRFESLVSEEVTETVTVKVDKEATFESLASEEVAETILLCNTSVIQFESLVSGELYKDTKN